MRRILLSALALVLLVAVPASAHPSVIADGSIVAGRTLRLTVVVLGDEAEFTGVDITLPSSVMVDDATAHGFTTTHAAHSVTLRGGDVNLGGTQLVVVDVTPSKAEKIDVAITSQFKDGRSFAYPTIGVGVSGQPVNQGGGGTPTSRWLIPVCALVVTAAVLGFLARRRYLKP